jgi:hypothetical protein
MSLQPHLIAFAQLSFVPKPAVRNRPPNQKKLLLNQIGKVNIPLLMDRTITQKLNISKYVNGIALDRICTI